MKAITSEAIVHRDTSYGVLFNGYATETDEGTRIVGLRLAAPEKFVFGRYWCHGHSSLAFWRFGYNLTGADLAKVLADEYRRVDKKPVCGDLVVWWSKATPPEIAHSARVESSSHRRGRSSLTVLSSKNGYGVPLKQATSIAEVSKEYSRDAWRLQTGDTISKQYYRRKLPTEWDALPIAKVLERSAFYDKGSTP